MKVLKFGGTSIGSPQRMKNVLEIINDEKNIIVVLSAMSGTTDKLINIAGLLHGGNKKEASMKADILGEEYIKLIPEIYDTNKYQKEAESVINSHIGYLRSFTLKEFSKKQEKAILAQGELMSTALFFLMAKEHEMDPSLLPALNFMRIDKDGEPDMFYIRENLDRELKNAQGKGPVITQGYICRNAYGDIDNLKRGGSDFTATIIGSVLTADEIQIWTDINGLHNNDPRYIDHTEVIRELSFDEAAELAYFGAKILHPSSVVPARSANIPVRLKNSMHPEDEGTIISSAYSSSGYKAIAAKDGITAIKIKSDRMLLAYGFLRKIFDIFELYKTAIDMITTSEVAVSLTIDDDTRIKPIIDDLKKLGTVDFESNQTIICIVGDFIAEDTGTTVEIFNALSKIPLRMISYGGSKHNISLLTNSSNKKDALIALHEHLFKK